jgi:hypothetical protein
MIIAGIAFAILVGNRMDYAPAGAIAVVTYFALKLLLAKRYAPVHEVSEHTARELQETEALRTRKQSFVSARADVQQEFDEKRRLQERLLALRTKMEQVGSELYASRIDLIGRALELTRKQLVVEEKLLREYDRTITMIEIEMETLDSARAVPTNIVEALEARTAELEALHTENIELRRQLEANEEVERVLRPSAQSRPHT